MKENQDNKQQSKTLFSIPLNGCLYIIILAAIAIMSVKGCKMVNMKYEEAKFKHEMIMDSLNKVRSDTLYVKGK